MSTVPHSGVVRRRFRFRGVVQGVGFRPHVYNLAQNIGIAGFIFNSSAGVTVEAEGSESALEEFLDSIRTHPPPLASIEEITTHELEPVGESDFEILSSQSEAGEFVLISPDVATCADCLREVNGEGNRRYGYPFTNCTNCGPRYTIIRDIPYDRPSTTMGSFAMCAECEAEYHDPRNRRFHAQPNACPKCGPSVALAKSGSFLPTAETYTETMPISRSVFADVRQLLREGAIVAVKGLGGFQLACDAANDDAVRRLRARKKRSDKPFAVMASDIGAIEKVCVACDADRELLLGHARPIVVLPIRADAKLSPALAPGNKTVGVMLPYTPLHAQLFGPPGAAPEIEMLVMTSGNISDEPIVTSNGEAWQRLAKVADYFLFHNRDIHMRVDDSVARTFHGKPRLLRRSRGYAPQPIDLGHKVSELLACGGELKNTFCLTKGQYAILSQHIGDVENYETLEFFRETLANLKKIFRAYPQVVAHDLHPLYLTSRLAAELDLPRVGVQHHHAHIASCMAENHLAGPVIGVAFDGTGYGTDGKIWGGEFLLADYLGFERRAHLRYVELPGGDAAVRQPWRSAVSWLEAAFPSMEIPEPLDIFRRVPERERRLVTQMVRTRVNTVATSSCGRLFDAVASLTGVRHEVTFEGQAAIELEMAAEAAVEDCYPFEFGEGEPAQIDMSPAIGAIVSDVAHKTNIGVISARFHNTMAEVIAEGCRLICHKEGLKRVCLSGGTFQNVYLLERAVSKLERAGFEVFLHSRVPANDGGIALGQAVIANEIANRGT